MQKKRSDTNKENMEDMSIQSVEEGFSLLEESVQKLSDESISLEDSFKEFEKGMKILKEVNRKIDRVEKQVKVITEEGMDEFQ